MAHKTHTIDLPTMTPGTTRGVVVHRFGKPGARPKAYLQAAIHANELPGAMALHYLMPMLKEADRKGLIEGEIVIVPTVNPIGLAQLAGNIHLGRYDFLGRENFNRNWLDLSNAVADSVGAKLGGDAKKNVSLIRSAALAELGEMKPQTELQTLRCEIMKLSVDADLVLDLHCDQDAVLHLFVSKKDVPGAAVDLAADIGAEATLYNEPYPEALTFSGVHGGLWARLAQRFPDAAIPQACTSATVEYRSQHDVSHALGESDANNLYRHLVRRGMIAGRAGKLPALKREATPIAGMDVGYSPATGITVFLQAKGAWVKKGDPIAEVIDPSDPRGPKARKQLKAQTNGVLFAGKQNGKLAWPGAVLYRIAGAKPLPHRKGLSGLDD
ncbi:MAG TPA: succinylglutamate desuccinylase/aspartoacylase family protein [Ramlibacter sp.]|uniref:succinylglutamate desuccinylase/aspartoacylase family protein n=1 Tax=Ramlibacter sp. TaxID=1917967 RepID=UPI002CCCA711|nr:succinylglutamate desuccinylase/aspartoacylase family protein [Ramlibacter sp.]HVZ43386.1 succinylglutamate desuccinylase/aspartoacylase family protein [Ramlibacter sp.]